MKDRNSYSPGPLGSLQLILITLKLCDLINWNWTRVFIPTFVAFGVATIIVLANRFYDYFKKHN